MKIRLTFIIIFFTLTQSWSQNYVTAYQYWCDTNFTSHELVSVIPTRQLELNTTLDFPYAGKGLHMYNIRFFQSNSYWSQTVSGYFYKTGDTTISQGLIDAYRYWVEGIDTSVTISLATPVNPCDLLVSLDLSWVHKGSNYLYIQFRDLQANWSIASPDSFYKSSIPVADFITDDTLFCGEDSVHFVNLSNDADLFMWHFGDGDSSDLFEPIHYYSIPGKYTVTLSVRDTILGTDSTITFTDLIHIMPQATATFTYSQSFLDVTFTNTSTNGVSYYWDFGDDSSSTLSDPVHTYLHDGNYTVILYVMDSCSTHTDTQYVSMILQSATLPSDNGVIIKNGLIQFNDDYDFCYVNVFTMTGQPLISEKLEHILRGTTFPLQESGFNTGIYLLDLTTNHGRRSYLFRVIK